MTGPSLTDLAALPHESHCPFGAQGATREQGDGCACITQEIVDQIMSEHYRKAVTDRIRDQAAEIESLRAKEALARAFCEDVDNGPGDGKVWAAAVLEVFNETPFANPNRAYWTSSDTWRDPDCIECGGEGAPCCDPPYSPYVAEVEALRAAVSAVRALCAGTGKYGPPEYDEHAACLTADDVLAALDG